jgi:hypothetical protein
MCPALHGHKRWERIERLFWLFLLPHSEYFNYRARFRSYTRVTLAAIFLCMENNWLSSNEHIFNFRGHTEKAG